MKTAIKKVILLMVYLTFNSSTSCSLLIQENADCSVVEDIKNFLKRIAPEDNYLHNTEGLTTCHHLKSLLTQSNLTMSVKIKK